VETSEPDIPTIFRLCTIAKHFSESRSRENVADTKKPQYLSNNSSTNLLEEVTYFKLDSYFERVVGSCDIAEDKPSSTPLLFALEESTLPINRENVFFVGDSITDVLCAQNANCLHIIYGQSISGYEGLLCFQHFDKLTDFIIKYLEDK
jgi:phosphoglycolate phosphatase